MTFYAIWNRLSSQVETDLVRIARNLTLHTLKLNSSGPVEFAYDHSLTRLLEAARRTQAQWCVTLQPGQLIKSADFFRDVENILCEQGSQTAYLELAPGLIAYRCDREVDQNLHPSKTAPSVTLAMTDLNVEASPEQLAVDLKGIQSAEWPSGSALEYLHYQCRGYSHEMFVFNTENYRAIEGKKKRRPLDALFTLASGFKDLFLLAAHGSHTQTQIHYFDLCPQSLLFKKYMFEKWDGRDFPAMLAQFISTHADPLTEVVPPLEPAQLNTRWLEELEQWGGESEFLTAFRTAQKLKQFYNCVDVVRNPQGLAKSLTETPGQQFAVWYSNCFGFTPALAQFNWDLDWIEGQGRRFLSSLHAASAQNDRQIVLYGPDIVTMGKSARTSRLASELYD